jgi:hypothetical protein
MTCRTTASILLLAYAASFYNHTLRLCIGLEIYNRDASMSSRVHLAKAKGKFRGVNTREGGVMHLKSDDTFR